MTRIRSLMLLPAIALGAGLAACAPYPADPYFPPGSYGVAPSAGYATPMPAYVGQAPVAPGYAAPGYAAPGYAAPGYAATVAAANDPYCREAYAAAAGAQQQAAITGAYADAARAQRTAGFYRRDC
ncbi:hypothetical protein J8J14_19815 [Roseomonas sp. SSH11]|uniref:Lipoprotein n=1 Tax=Pararoseomonas baculiformis TaxID=2820812 RepID=A0ABS4AKJ8_9PROT|nr:hypothetical protein [Pararoseomonas baculiformis]MBP0447025.1 hypothetical protein [Pararoseomonas baculiformis]